MNPYVFVVGCPRSGTTLLQRMLDSHPQLSVANDTHFIPKMIETDGDVNPHLTPDLIEKIISYHRFSRLEIKPERVRELANGRTSYREFVGALYDEYANVRGKEFGGEKTPDYVKHLLTLHRLFPRSKLIHIIRDGRNAALSILEWAAPGKGPAKLKMWQEQPLLTAAIWWKWLVTKGIDDGTILGNDVYYEVRYEELVADPETVLRGVASFLNLPFSSRMVTYYEGKIKTETGLSAKKAWLPPTPNLRNWKTQMSSTDIRLFEASAGDLISSLGYPRAFERIPSEIVAMANHYEELWFAEIQRRINKSQRHSL